MQISLGPKRLRPCDIPTVAADLAAAFMAAGTLFLCRDYREGLLATDTTDVFSHCQIVHGAIADRFLKEHPFFRTTRHYDLHRPA